MTKTVDDRRRTRGGGELYDEAARARLGSAFHIYAEMKTGHRQGYRIDPPDLAIRKRKENGVDQFFIVVELWWEARDGWEISTALASDVSYDTCAEAYVALTDSVALDGEHFGPWRVWFDPPPIGTRECDWHYQHEDAEPECPAWMHGHCASRDACIAEIIDGYEERA